MVAKYRAKKIKSVIHFRRIMEAFEVAEDKQERQAVSDRLREYILTTEMETRHAFDGFILDSRKIQKAVNACDTFIHSIRREKVDFAIDGKAELLTKLLEVIRFAQDLMDKLEGEDPPVVDDTNDD